LKHSAAWHIHRGNVGFSDHITTTWFKNSSHTFISYLRLQSKNTQNLLSPTKLSCIKDSLERKKSVTVQWVLLSPCSTQVPRLAIKINSIKMVFETKSNQLAFCLTLLLHERRRRNIPFQHEQALYYVTYIYQKTFTQQPDIKTGCDITIL
jgi:hypothetical protein